MSPTTKKFHKTLHIFADVFFLRKLGESVGIKSVILARSTKEKLNKQKPTAMTKTSTILQLLEVLERWSKLMGNENRLKLD